VQLVLKELKEVHRRLLVRKVQLVLKDHKDHKALLDLRVQHHLLLVLKALLVHKAHKVHKEVHLVLSRLF
jgi:hypothetical protein